MAAADVPRFNALIGSRSTQLHPEALWSKLVANWSGDVRMHLRSYIKGIGWLWLIWF
jgi:hypothetical protein